jgi:hypothetical protein
VPLDRRRLAEYVPPNRAAALSRSASHGAAKHAQPIQPKKRLTLAAVQSEQSPNFSRTLAVAIFVLVQAELRANYSPVWVGSGSGSARGSLPLHAAAHSVHNSSMTHLWLGTVTVTVLRISFVRL